MPFQNGAFNARESFLTRLTSSLSRSYSVSVLRMKDGQTKAVTGVPTTLDKKFLVWSGQFKNESSIPGHVEEHMIHRARSWGRIRLNVSLLLLTAGACGLMALQGKRAARRGESVEQINLDWHKAQENYTQKTPKH